MQILKIVIYWSKNRERGGSADGDRKTADSDGIGAIFSISDVPFQYGCDAEGSGHPHAAQLHGRAAAVLQRLGHGAV